MAKKHIRQNILSLILSAVICLSATGCSLFDSSSSDSRSSSSLYDSSVSDSSSSDEIFSSTESLSSEVGTRSSSEATSQTTTTTSQVTTTSKATTTTTTRASSKFNTSLIPAYSGSAYVAINGNNPFFSSPGLTRSLRCCDELYWTRAYANRASWIHRNGQAQRMAFSQVSRN